MIKKSFLTMLFAVITLLIPASGKRLYFGATESIPGATIINWPDLHPNCVYFNNGTDQTGNTLPSPDYILRTVYSNLEERVYKSSTRYDRENVNALELGKIDLVENIQASQRVFDSNYAILRNYDNWTVYHLDVPDDCASLMIKNNGSTEGIEAKWSVAYKGKTKSGWDTEKAREKFSQACPVFALGAQVVNTKSHNTAARIGTGDMPELSSGDRFYAYRTYLDKKTNKPLSKRIAVMRAIKISHSSMRDTNNDSTLFFQIAGHRTPSENYGDVLVYSPDKKMATGIAGTLQQGMAGFRVDLDWMYKMSRMGFANYMMVTIGLKTPYKKLDDWYILDKEDDYVDVNVIQENKYSGISYIPQKQQNRKTQKRVPRLTGDVRKIEQMIIPYFRVGYGLGFHFWHSLEIRPYVMLGVDIPILFENDPVKPEPDMKIFSPLSGRKNKDGTDDIDAMVRSFGLNFTGTAGVRFTLNIRYPLQVYLGAEYNYGYFASKWDRGLNNSILRPAGINQQTNFGLYAGLKWCF